jgi:siroheme synthase (precorrin-2 oxidase/ferrochelatase)
MDNYILLALNMENKKILIIGACSVAFRKFLKLRDYSSEITIISEDFSEDFDDYNFKKIQATLSLNNLLIIELVLYDLVFIATNNHLLNKEIALECERLNILYNNASSQDMAFKMVSTFNIDDISIGIRSDNLKKTKEIKNKILGYLSNYFR